MATAPILRDRPLPVRWAVIGAGSAAVVGCLIGLVVGLLVHPPTAWFAVFELGVPASALGALIGLAFGALAIAFRRGDRSTT
jgi:hypothetical protein